MTLDLSLYCYQSPYGDEHCLWIFLDLSKAFDSVSHSLLLKYLENIARRGTALNLFQNYLVGKIQMVRVGTEIKIKNWIRNTAKNCTWTNVNINGLFHLENHSQIIRYADDTAVLYESETWGSLKEKAERIFTKIKQWFGYKLLTLNLNKFITFGIDTCFLQHLINWSSVLTVTYLRYLLVQKSDKDLRIKNFWILMAKIT